MNIEEIREYCISIKGVEEALPFGPEILVFKIMGKIFFLAGLDNNPIQFNLKCEPEKAIALREQFPFVIPGYHMNKKHWNTIILDGSATSDQLKQWISDSYELVVSGLSKIQQKRLAEMK